MTQVGADSIKESGTLQRPERPRGIEILARATNDKSAIQGQEFTVVGNRKSLIASASALSSVTELLSLISVVKYLDEDVLQKIEVK